MFGKKPYIIVVRQLGGVGDVLMMSCVYRGLREKFPKHKICTVASDLYAGGAVNQISAHNPFIDEIHNISPYEGSTKKTRQVWNEHYQEGPLLEDDIWFQKADHTYDLNTVCMEMEMRATRPSVQKEFGAVPLIPRYKIWCNAAEVEPSSYRPVYVISKQERRDAQAFWDEKGWNPRETVFMGLGTCDEKRTVPMNILVKVAEGIMGMGMRPVTIDHTRKIEGCDYIIGKQIPEIMAIMERGRMCVSADSGILHMAGTLDVPVIGLFGPTDPDMRMDQYRGSAINARALVPCAPCMYEYHCLHQRNPDLQFACLKSINPTVVVDELCRWRDATN